MSVPATVAVSACLILIVCLFGCCSLTGCPGWTPRGLLNCTGQPDAATSERLTVSTSQYDYSSYHPLRQSLGAVECGGLRGTIPYHRPGSLHPPLTH
jgi:hypothetical protein